MSPNTGCDANPISSQRSHPRDSSRLFSSSPSRADTTHPLRRHLIDSPFAFTLGQRIPCRCLVSNFALVLSLFFHVSLLRASTDASPPHLGAMADYVYAFKAPPPPPQHQDQYGYHSHAPSASSYISPLPSSSSTAPHSSFTNSNVATPNSGTNTSTSNPIAPPTALLWTDLKLWMDADYARQVCALVRWEAGILVPSPHPPSSSSTCGGVNNAGYELLSFASKEAAAGALAKSVVLVPCTRLLFSGAYPASAFSRIHPPLPWGFPFFLSCFGGSAGEAAEWGLQAMTQSGNIKAICVPVQLQGSSRRARARAGARTPITGASYSTGRAMTGWQHDARGWGF
ncbi:hypothetical protein B0H14DRAFT_3897101 [Mycena olivaceomarginata]|nr:hypothetical protein B0H14DRAFT_3897101 [Mycena olivaceomarginata]